MKVSAVEFQHMPQVEGRFVGQLPHKENESGTQH